MQRLISLFRRPQEYLPLLNDEAPLAAQPNEDEEPEYFRQILDYLREQKARDNARQLRQRNRAIPEESRG